MRTIGFGSQVPSVRILLLITVLCTGFFFGGRVAYGQVATGVPPFASLQPSSVDTVNLANLNVTYSFPLLHKAGRGLPFDALLVYNSSVWAPVTSGTSTTWTPTTTSTWGWNFFPSTGAVSFSTYGGSCIQYPGGKYVWTNYNNFIYTDALGTKHPFNITISDWSLQSIPCGSGAPPASGSATANDGSGYTLSVNASLNYPGVTLGSLRDRSGNSYAAPVGGVGAAGTVTDPNGNQITVNGSNFVDTLGMTALTVGGSGTQSSPSTYTYYAPDGSQKTYTVKYTLYTVQTNFACFGVTNYNANGTLPQVNLVTEIDLPDQATTNPADKYTFTYETTYGDNHSPHWVTGRLASVTLPTGGQIVYLYNPSGQGGTNGINCADGSTSQLYRQTPDTGYAYQSWWYYNHTINANNWTTQLTTPAGDQTTYTFQGTLETERNNSEEDMVTCYNGNTTNCNTTAVSLPITQITSTKTLGTLKSKTNTNINGYGLPTEVDEYAFGSGAPPSTPLRKTLTTYNTSLGNIKDRPSDIQVQDSGGTAYARTTFGYDTHGNLNLQTLYTGGTPSTVSRSFSPNTYGVVTASTDYNSHSTSVTSFQCANNTAFPHTFSYPDGTSSSIEWNCYVGLPTSVTGVNGNTTTYTYDNMIRLTGTSYPDGGGWTTDFSTSTTSYDVYTNVFGSTQRRDQATLDLIDHQTITKLVNDPEGATSVSTSFDSLGRPSTVTNPYRGSSGVGDTYTYDSLNRITRVTHADTSHSHADINYHQGTAQTCSAGTYGYGYSTVYTDEVGNQRQTFTDGLGRMIEVDEPNSSGTLNVNTCYKYDILGNLREVDQGSLTRMYTYDMLSPLTNATTPEAKGNTSHFDYTTSGGGLCAGDPNAVCRRTDERAVTTTYTYDNMNRLTGKSYPHDPSVTYYYNQASYNGLTIANKNGNRTGMSDAAGTTAWSYDSMGRVVTEKGTIASVTRTISYSYNKDGSLYSVTYPSGKTVTYDPNAVGRPTNAKDLVNGINYVTNATYSPQGTLASATFGSNITATYGYDSSRLWVNNIQAAKISPSTTFFSLQPAYNTNGTVSGVTNALNSDYTTSYTYDNLNRWITAKTTGIGIWGLAVPSGGYDRSGNLLQVNVTQGYAPGLNISVNAYNQITGWNYDSAGNVTSDGTYSYQWNDEGLLSNDGSINYTYDGLGRREVRYSGTNFWFNQAGQLLGATINGGTTLANEYIYFNGMRVAANVPTNTIYYYFGDQIGSLRTVTDSSGNVCYNGDYTPLGYRNNYLYYCMQEFGFAGMKLEAEIPTYNTMFREYSYGQGRWLSPDPDAGDINNPQSLNRYAYVTNNPLALTDPTGLQGNNAINDVCQWHPQSYLSPCSSFGFQRGFPGWDVFRWWDVPVYVTVSTWVPGHETPHGGPWVPGYWTTTTYTLPAGMFIAGLIRRSGAPGWWGTFLSEFAKLSGGPGGKPTCAGQALSHMADTLNPLTPGVSTATELVAPVAQGVAINRSLAQTTAAIDEYIVQQGLTVPLRSSVVRNAISLGVEDAVALGTKVNVAVQTGAVDYAAFMSMLTTMSEARSGGCAAAFPVF